MSKAQQKFGEPLELVRKKIFPVMNAMVQDFIRQAPFAVLATASGEGDCDASPKGGRPGFVKVLDESHLLIPDIKGNKLFQSYENVESNAKAGLVFLIPGCDWTCRVNGSVKVVYRDDWPLVGVETEVFAEDEMTSLLQGLLMAVSEAYSHCPRAFMFSKLWDVESIEKTVAQDPNRYWLDRWRQSMEGQGEPMP